MRVHRLALEERIGHAHPIPPEVGHHVLRDVYNTLAGDQRERERRVDQRLAERGLRGVVHIEMQRSGILRQ